MSQLSQALAQASNKNKELLSTLAQTDHAPVLLKQNGTYIADLRTQITKTEKELTRLHTTTESERKDHVRYRDSTVKRFAYRLGGQKGASKFDTKVEKEEREFFQALAEEKSCLEAKEELERALHTAETDKTNLGRASEQHDAAQRELDALYQHIFSGPTPDVPGEDQLEQSVQQCRQWFDGCVNEVGRESHAAEYVKQADSAMSAANFMIQEALSCSTWDMWGGGTYADMMERDALAKTQNHLMHATRYIMEARHVQPAIQEIHPVEIDQGHMLSDVVFDNIFSDMAQHDRIQSSQMQLQRSTQQLKVQVTEQQKRLEDAESRHKQATEALDNARRELQSIRSEAFERYAGPEGTYAPPPAYSG